MDINTLRPRKAAPKAGPQGSVPKAGRFGERTKPEARLPLRSPPPPPLLPSLSLLTKPPLPAPAYSRSGTGQPRPASPHAPNCEST